MISLLGFTNRIRPFKCPFKNAKWFARHKTGDIKKHVNLQEAATRPSHRHHWQSLWTWPCDKTGCKTFRAELGRVTSVQATFSIDNSIARFCKSRPVLHVMREKVSAELENLEKQGIIEGTPHSDWATPIVPVIKADGVSLRICGNFHTTANAALKTEWYPIPRIEDMYATLVGG